MLSKKEYLHLWEIRKLLAFKRLCLYFVNSHKMYEKNLLLPRKTEKTVVVIIWLRDYGLFCQFSEPLCFYMWY